MTTIRVQRQIEELMEQMFPGLDIAAITPTDPVNDKTDVYLIEMEDGREYWAFDDQSDIRMLSKNSIYADPADAYEALEALRESLAQEEIGDRALPVTTYRTALGFRSIDCCKKEVHLAAFFIASRTAL